MQIGNKRISEDETPFIIAEMSGNHKGDLDTALAIVDSAAATGVDALKIQTYTADTMTLDVDREEFKISDQKSLWANRKLYDLYQEAHTPWEWHKAIFDRCKEKNIIGFSSPFDETAVDFLEELKVPLYKVASFELIDIPLLKKIASTKKPVIVSTGMASISEIYEGVKALKDNGCSDVIILKCTSGYPTPPEFCNINAIATLRDVFQCPVGLSDHTMGIGVSLAALALGACVVEKHFILSRKDGGVDSAFSMEPEEMAQLVKESKVVQKAMGKKTLGALSIENTSKSHRRSIFVSSDIQSGERFTTANIRRVRPGNGLEPKYYEQLLGMQSKTDLTKGTPLDWSHIK